MLELILERKVTNMVKLIYKGKYTKANDVMKITEAISDTRNNMDESLEHRFGQLDCLYSLGLIDEEQYNDINYTLEMIKEYQKRGGLNG